jgi:hypothetical protein
VVSATDPYGRILGFLDEASKPAVLISGIVGFEKFLAVQLLVCLGLVAFWPIT